MYTSTHTHSTDTNPTLFVCVYIVNVTELWCVNDIYVSTQLCCVLLLNLNLTKLDLTR